MKVYVEKENKYLEINKSLSGEQLLKDLNINPTTVILVKNNEVILSDELLSETDEVKILSVVSGG